MIKRIFAGKFWLVMSLSLILLTPSQDALAWWGRAGRPQREVIIMGHDRYHYRDGRFYRPGWFGREVIVVAPPRGAVVRVLPFGYRAIVVRGAPYYYYENVYYSPCPNGYVVVPAPY